MHSNPSLDSDRDDGEPSSSTPTRMYKAIGLECFAGSATETIVVSAATGGRDRLPAAVAGLLRRCDTFATLDEHAAAVVSSLGLVPDRCEPIRRTLEALALRGLMVDTDRVRRELSAARAEPPAAVTTVGVLACDRPASVIRTLRSIIENQRAAGRARDYVVVDDSRLAPARATIQAGLRELSKEYGVDVWYAGPEQKLRFIETLVREGNVRRDALEFAIRPHFSGLPSYGANRNALLLHAAGEAYVSMDDDVLCHVTPAPRRAAGLGFAGPHEMPTECWFFAEDEALMRAVSLEDVDAIGLHESMLGRTVAHACLAPPEGGPLDLGGLDLRLLWALRRGRVRLTLPGYFGDHGMGSNLSYLTMEGPSRGRLVESSDYTRLLRSRHILRVARTATIVSDATVYPSQAWGLDNRRLLPPFFPVMRGEETSFAFLLERCLSPDCAALLPWAFQHAPVESRTDQTPFRDASLGNCFAHVMAAVLEQGARRLPATAGSPPALATVAAHFRAVGSATLDDFEAEVGSILMSARMQDLDAISRAQAQAPPDSPWSRDLAQYRESVLTGMADEDFVLALDLVDDVRRSTEARALGQELIARYGTLLEEWPHIVDATCRLRDGGTRMGVRMC